MDAAAHPFSLWNAAILPALAWSWAVIYGEWGLIAGLWGYLSRAFQAAAERQNGSLKMLIDFLGEQNVFRAYRNLLQRRLDDLTHWLGDGAPPGEPRHAFTTHSYMSLVGFAVAYPVLFLALGWAFWGSAGTLGTIEVLPPSGSALVRVGTGLVLIAVVVLARIFVSHQRVKNGDVAGAFAGVAAFSITFAVISLLTGPGAFAFAFAGVVTVAGSGAGGVPGVIAVAIIIACAVAVALGQAGAGLREIMVGVIGAFAVLGGIATLVKYTDRTPAFVRLFTVAFLFALLTSSLLAFAYYSPHIKWLAFGNSQAGILLFLAVLPVANSLPDWLSFAVSRKLLHSIATGNHGPLASFSFAVLDLVLAVVFLVFMTLLAVGLVSLFDRLHVLGGGNSILSVPALLDAMKANPLSPNFGWIYFMLFTTLVPTFVHFVVAAMTVIFAPLLTPWGRQVTIGLLSAKDNVIKRLAGAIIVATMWTASVVLVALLILASIHLLLSRYPVLATTLFAWAKHFALLIRSWRGPL